MGMYILKIVDFLVLSAGRTENLDIRLLTRVGHLRNASAIPHISFIFENFERLIHLLARDVQFALNADAHIDHSLFVHQLFELFSGVACGSSSYPWIAR